MIRKALVAVFLAVSSSVYADMSVVYDGWLKAGQANAAVVARGVGVADIVRATAYLAGGSIVNPTKQPYGINRPLRADAWYPTIENGVLTVQFQIVHGGNYVKCVVVKFADQGSDLIAWADSSRYYNKSSPVAGKWDLLTTYTKVNTVAEDAASADYGVMRLELHVAGRAQHAYIGALSLTSQNLWNGVDLTRVTDLSAIISGSYMAHPMHAAGYFTTTSGAGLSSQLQAWIDGGDTNSRMNRYANVSLDSEEDAVSGKIDWMKYYRYDYNLGVDASSRSGGNWGTYASDKIGTDAVNSPNCVRNFCVGLSLPERSSVCSSFLSTNEEITVWTDVSLQDVVGVQAEPAGGYVGTGAVAYPCRFVWDGTSASVQYQWYHSSYVKCIKFALRQDGNNVVGKAVYARAYYTTNAGKLGMDFDNPPSGTREFAVVTDVGGNGYGIRNLQANLVPAAERATAFVWKGNTGSTQMSQGSNWQGGVAPAAGASVYFRDGTSSAIQNDLAAGTSFAKLVFAPGRTMTLSGQALVADVIENASDVGAVVITAPVSCVGNFEPWTGGGLSFENLTVAGTLAPRGPSRLGPLGTVSAGRLSGGNYGSWTKGLFGTFGSYSLNPVSGARAATYASLDADLLRKEVLILDGTNTVQSPVWLPQDARLAVTNGLAMLSDLVLPDATGPRVILGDRGQIHLNAWTNYYRNVLTFAGTGKVSFGARGLAADHTNAFDAVTFATCGSDYTVSGGVTVDPSAVPVFAPHDPDGTPRTITLATKLIGSDTISVVGAGTLRVLPAVASGSQLVVQAGFFEPMADTTFASIELTGGGFSAPAGATARISSASVTGSPAALQLGADGTLVLPGQAVDCQSVDLMIRDFTSATSVLLEAASIVNVPTRRQLTTGGKKCWLSVEQTAGGERLVATTNPPGLVLLFR